jgi:hypothetical protein
VENETVFMLKHLNGIRFIGLGGVVLIFINTGGKLRNRVFKNICFEIGITAANCKKPVQLLCD